MKRALRLSLGLGFTASRATPTPTPSGPTDSTYYSMLASDGMNGAFLGSVDFGAYEYQPDGITSSVANQSHAIRMSGQRKRVRLKLQQSDYPTVSRSELESKITFPDGVERWYAFSCIFEAFGDPAAMASLGGAAVVFHQVHMGATGSPAVSLRRGGDGKITIRTTGTAGGDNVDRYTETTASSFGVVEDWVVRVVISTTAGQLQVWKNGVELCNLSGLNIGAGDSQSYWKFGIYASGGIGDTATYPNSSVAVQYANVVPPQAGSLASRVTSAPAWPQDLLVTTNCPTVVARQASDAGTTNLATWSPTLAAHSAGDYLLVVASIDDIDWSATATDTAGWSLLTRTHSGAAGGSHQAILYYGSGGTMTAAPSGAVTAPVLNLTTEQATAVALTIQAGSAPTIAGAGAQFSSQARLMNPPSLDLGSERAALWIACASTNGSTVALTRHPAGYSNGVAQESPGTNSCSTYTAEYRATAQSENPSGFEMANTRIGVAHTVAVSVA